MVRKSDLRFPAHTVIVTRTKISQANNAVFFGKVLQLNVGTVVLINNHVAFVTVRDRVDFKIASPDSVFRHMTYILCFTREQERNLIETATFFVHEREVIALMPSYVFHRLPTHFGMAVLVSK